MGGEPSTPFVVLNEGPLAAVSNEAVEGGLIADLKNALCVHIRIDVIALEFSLIEIALDDGMVEGI